MRSRHDPRLARQAYRTQFGGPARGPAGRLRPPRCCAIGGCGVVGCGAEGEGGRVCGVGASAGRPRLSLCFRFLLSAPPLSSLFPFYIEGNRYRSWSCPTARAAMVTTSEPTAPHRPRSVHALTPHSLLVQSRRCAGQRGRPAVHSPKRSRQISSTTGWSKLSRTRLVYVRPILVATSATRPALCK